MLTVAHTSLCIDAENTDNVKYHWWILEAIVQSGNKRKKSFFYSEKFHLSQKEKRQYVIALFHMKLTKAGRLNGEMFMYLPCFVLSSRSHACGEQVTLLEEAELERGFCAHCRAGFCAMLMQ